MPCDEAQKSAVWIELSYDHLLTVFVLFLG